MRNRLIFAAVCILTLPLLFSTSRSNLRSPAAFSTVAMAGHTTLGGWCECGSSYACICDPGEEPAGQRVHPAPIDSKRTQGKPAELGSGILLVLAALLIGLRYKA